MNIERIAQMLSSIAAKKVKVEFAYDTGHSQTFNVIIDEKIVFDLFYIEGEELIPTFTSAESLIDFTNTFHPVTHDCLKNIYSELQSFVVTNKIQVTNDNKDNIEDFVSSFYYDRPYNYYSFFERDESNQADSTGLIISSDFSINEHSIGLVLYLTTNIDDKTHTIKYSEKEKLFIKLTELYSSPINCT
jgi:hypothetical protein